MICPPAFGPIHSVLAANQVLRIPLLSERYAAHDAGGRKLFVVSREKALEGIAAGAFVPVGRTCVKYLRINSAADPARSERYAAPKTWTGPRNPGEGSRAIYEHNEPMCNSWAVDSKGKRIRSANTPLSCNEFRRG
jgi:hypothetical protein